MEISELQKTDADLAPSSTLKTPFHNIALAMSGGGFRAASFSLGTLTYLEQIFYDEEKKIKLLDRVSFISSTSGGTITAACYALAQRKGTSFDEFYQSLFKNLEGDTLLRNALNHLCDDSQWSTAPGEKRRTIINAFAMEYDACLFKGATMNDLCDVKDGLCGFSFNATEFTDGISFRFQHDNYTGTNTGLIGNAKVFFNTTNDAYKKLKLADMLAASSCFPGGFEPIVFPDDFRYPNLPANTYDNALRVREGGKVVDAPIGMRVALMDGGIDDNQGVYSVMLADDRRTEEQKFDLILSSDVTSFYIDPYQPIDPKPAEGWRAKTITDYLLMITKARNVISRIPLIIGIPLLIFVTGAWLLNNTIAGSILTFMSGSLFIGFIAAVAIKRGIKKNKLIEWLTARKTKATIRKALEQIGASNNFSDKTVDQLTDVLATTKLASLEMMLKARASSVLVLSMDINLKQTRRLIYAKFYESPIWNLRRVYCATFDLSTHNKAERKYRIQQKQDWNPTPNQKQILLDGCDKIEEVAERSRNMGTTLWFSDEEVKQKMLRDLVVCGQFTCCGNLLKYVFSLKQSIVSNLLVLDQVEINRLDRIETQLLTDWDAFKKDPYCRFGL